MPYRLYLNIIGSSIDWMSIKLNIPVLPVLFIPPHPVIFWLGVAATFSTLLYNGIRIYKELKTKK
jgi:hypothetical protein